MDELSTHLIERLEEIVSLLIAIEQNTRPPTPKVTIEKSKRSAVDKDNIFG